MDVDAEDIGAQSENPDAGLEYFEDISGEIEAEVAGMRAALKQVDLVDPELQEEHHN